jgi:hypothetical protein
MKSPVEVEGHIESGLIPLPKKEPVPFYHV